MSGRTGQGPRPRPLPRLAVGRRAPQGPLVAAFAVLTVFMVVEVVGGLAHQLAGPAVRRRPHAHRRHRHRHGPRRHPPRRRGSERSHRTFGWYRLEILAALANAVLLLGVAVYVLVEAIRRFSEPADVLAGPMLVIAVARPRRQPHRLRAAAGGLQGVAERRGRLPRGARRHRRLGRRDRRRDRPAGHRLDLGRPGRRRRHRRVDRATDDPPRRAGAAHPRAGRAAGHRHRRRCAPTSPPSTASSTSTTSTSGRSRRTWTSPRRTSWSARATDHHGVLDRARDLLRERYGIGHATLQVEPEDHTGCDEVGW